MDAIWTALHGSRPSRRKNYDKDEDYMKKHKKKLDLYCNFDIYYRDRIK